MIRLSVFLSVILLSACAPTDQVNTISGPTMGTSYHIAWRGDGADAEALKIAVDQRLIEINKSMSTYDPQSELSLINKGEVAVDAEGWIAVSDGLEDVLQDSLAIHNKSEGLFDPTVGPLVNLWGFGPQASLDKVPSDAELDAAKQKVGFEALTLDGASTRIRLSSPRYIDLSAIAKGWGVDQIAELLEHQGHASYMVEIGGEIRTAGVKPDGQAWRIAIERPNSELQERAVELIIQPGSAAIATSGDYRNYFEQDGVRYSHTINPFSGRPITHTLASVTVVADNCAMADGWATALNVAGPEKGLELAERNGLAVFMIVRDGDGFAERTSSAFRAKFPHYESL
ncbi:FAD:protein FMN transferase [Thalassolituus sp. LLYu03]|uniref:FAD:protein FMN transferase n=1 Tax=Thalassolituus sp. LLYu03 TaxID=3421656 RepID=UPI003D281B65